MIIINFQHTNKHFHNFRLKVQVFYFIIFLFFVLFLAKHSVISKNKISDVMFAKY